jgi:hypothetical protein
MPIEFPFPEAEGSVHPTQMVGKEVLTAEFMRLIHGGNTGAQVAPIKVKFQVDGEEVAFPIVLGPKRARAAVPMKNADILSNSSGSSLRSVRSLVGVLSGNVRGI